MHAYTYACEYTRCMYVCLYEHVDDTRLYRPVETVMAPSEGVCGHDLYMRKMHEEQRVEKNYLHAETL